MIADLKPYAEYKESGLPWLGQVPAHWEVQRLKNWVTINRQTLGEETPPDFAFDYLDIGSVTTGRLASRPSHLRFASAPSRARRLLQPGDTIVSTVRTYLKAVMTVGEHTQPLVASTGFAVLSPRPDTTPRCLGYVAQSEAFTHQVTAESVGIAYPAISETRLGNIAVTLPPPEEQAAIVRFLDWANGRLERATRSKRKVIALLGEQKQAIIHRAVTRGLDPSVPLKPSGIPWLGDIPQHWDVRRMKHGISPIEQGWSPQCDAQPADEDEWGVLKVGCVNKDAFSPKQNKKLPASLQPDHSLEVRDGDILVSRANTRELLGLAALAENPPAKRILCDKLFRFRARENSFNSKFLVLALRAKPCREQIESSTNGASSSMQNIGQGVLKNLWVSMPSVAEQERIVTHITAATQPASVAISRLEREIELLREYRTRFVADVVTGKLDVREAAARLPDEAPLDTVEDDPNLADEAEPADEETAA